MQKLLYTLGLLLTIGLASVQAQIVSVSGTVRDSSTGSGLANAHLIVTIYDSLTSNIVSQSGIMTDSTGFYTYTYSTANGPSLGNGSVRLEDCNGVIQDLHFGFTNGNANLTNFDFWICTSGSGIGCQAAFIMAPTNTLLTYQFTDASFWLHLSGPPFDYAWDFGDGTTGTGLPMYHTFPSTGIYQICLTTTSILGCVSTFCDSLMIGLVGPTCQSTMNWGLLPSGAYGFTVAASGSGTPVIYSYDFGNGDTYASSNDTIVYTYPIPGTYYACVDVHFSDACQAISCISAGLTSLNCQANFTAMPDTTGQYSLLLANNTTGTGLMYGWDFGDGGTSNLAYPSHTYAGPGTYQICLSVADSMNTCGSTFCDSITVINKLGSAFTIQVVPGALTASPSAAASFSDLNIFPNPANEKVELEIQLQRAGNVHCEILDLSGRRIAMQNTGFQPAGSQRLTFDVQDIPAGMYLIRMQAGTSVTTQKLSIAH